VRAEPRARPARDAAQTRERILRAAVEEFGAKGYAGARTAGIAARAGVNQQLISYHFGGKRGLLAELRRQWAQTEAALVPADASFAEAVSAYLDATLDRPSWARLVIWQALGEDSDDEPDHAAAQRTKLRQAVERIRRRQRSGEITADVEAEFVLLLAYALAFAPIALPQIVEGIFGVDPHSAEYRRRALPALLTLVDPERSRR
jgi:TetR/AcrR family transcriptional regulator